MTDERDAAQRTFTERVYKQIVDAVGDYQPEWAPTDQAILDLAREADEIINTLRSADVSPPSDRDAPDYSGKNPRCAKGCPEDTRCDYDECPGRKVETHCVVVPIARLWAALNYIKHCGAGAAMRGEPHPQQMIVDWLEEALAAAPSAVPAQNAELVEELNEHEISRKDGSLATYDLLARAAIALSRQAQVPAVGAIKLWLTMKNGEPFAAYPREIQAKVYASGCSSSDGVEIIEGEFHPSERNG